MQRGKCSLSWSMDDAVMVAPGTEELLEDSNDGGVEKFFERWFRIGVSRSSSSSRGMAREVSCICMVRHGR